MKLLIILLSLTFIACDKTAEEVEQALKQPIPESSVDSEPNETITSNETYTVIRDESDRYEGFNATEYVREGLTFFTEDENRTAFHSTSLKLKADGKFTMFYYFYAYGEVRAYYVRNMGDYKVELINHNGEEKILFTLIMKTARIRNIANGYWEAYSDMVDHTDYVDTYVLGVTTKKKPITNTTNEIKFIYNEFTQSIEKFEDDIMGNLIGTEFDRVY